jgi:hypothetical protein
MVAVRQLFSEPPAYKLPLSKGNDLLVKFIYKPLVVDGAGSPVLDANGKKQFVEENYPVGSSVSFFIDSEPPVVFEAEITESVAVVLGDFLAIDGVKNGALWRVVLTYPDGVNKVMCNGIVVRADGK